MLLMLLFVPTRMVAQTPTEDSRYALFKNLEGITDVTITDNGSYPWQELDLNAEGMTNLGFTIPEGSKGLMSSNYHVDGSSSETVVNFTVEKPMLLTFKYLVSSEDFDKATITLDNKEPWTISEIMQIGIKALLSVGKHSLKLSYTKDESENENADRTCIYDLKTATTFSEYVADYVATNSTLTFKNITSDNLEGLDFSRIAIVYDEQPVEDMCVNLGIETTAIKNIVFDESFKTYTPTSLRGFFINCKTLETISGLKYLNTANVTDMSLMFYGCSALTTIFVSDKFVTDQVTDGREMFHMCINLIGAIEYDGSKSDHTYANYENGYFSPEGGFHAYAELNKGTRTLTFRRGLSKSAGAYDLNVGNNTPEWSTQKDDINKVVFDASFANARPTSCYKWFDGCANLTDIEGIENLNTEKVTNMGSMFSGCYVLTSLDVSNFNTQNVEDMSYMFNRCIYLTSLDVSNFNTQNVEKMGFMFSCCEGLNFLDLSKFDTQNVTNMSYMFWRSSALTTIYVSDKFVTTKVSSGAKMFQGCTNLKGFIDYISNSDKDNNEYANYKTGYFSKLVGKNGEEKIGAAGETLATENLVLDDGKDFVAYDQFAAKNAFYIRVIPEGSTWGTLCLPFAIGQSQETECKFYRLTGIDADNKCITLEGCEEGKIPAGTPVLFKMNENEPTLSISVQNVGIVTKPKAETNTEDVNLVGSFTKIGGNGNQGLDKNDYIIGKDKFWRVFDLNDGNGVGIKPMRAYIHPANEYLARAAMLSIGKGDGTTAIDNLNAISNDANAEYYDANGRRTNGLQKGLNIVKRGSKTYKIMVK